MISTSHLVITVQSVLPRGYTSMKQGTVRNTVVGALVAGALAAGITTVGAQGGSSTNPTVVATSATQTVPGVATPPAVPTTTTNTTSVPGVATPPATQNQPAAPQGPPDGGPPVPPGGPAAMVGTQSGAASDLQHAYRSAGDYLTLVGTGSASNTATSLFNSSKTYYAQALTAYNAGKYTLAHNYADASAHASGAATHLVRADRGTTTTTVPGLTAPPATSTDSSQDKAARELNNAYRHIGQIVSLGSTDQTVSATVASAKSVYQAALDDYNAQKYDASSERAHAAADIADVGLRYAQAVSS